MPKTTFQSLVFTAVTAWIMVYIMTLYNTVLSAQSFTNATFLSALKGMWVEYVIIFLCAFFISSPIAKFLAFRVVKPGDRPIFIIFAIQIFTGVSGGSGQYPWSVPWVRLYRTDYSQLSADLLQKFYYGPSGAAFYRRACGPVAVSAIFVGTQSSEAVWGKIYVYFPSIYVRNVLKYEKGWVEL